MKQLSIFFSHLFPFFWSQCCVHVLSEPFSSPDCCFHSWIYRFSHQFAPNLSSHVGFFFFFFNRIWSLSVIFKPHAHYPIWHERIMSYDPCDGSPLIWCQVLQLGHLTNLFPYHTRGDGWICKLAFELVSRINPGDPQQWQKSSLVFGCVEVHSHHKN